MWLDDVSGLYHVRARTYDAATGRFLSRDPVAGVMGAPETLLSYGFNLYNPLSFRDPEGTFSLGETSAVVAVVSVLAGMSAGSVFGYLNAVRRRTGRDQGKEAEHNSEVYRERVAQCISETRLIDHTPLKFDKLDQLFDILEGKGVPDGLDQFVDDVVDVPGTLGAGTGALLWALSTSTKAGGKMLPLNGAPSGASSIMLTAYALRHAVVSATSSPGVLRFAHQIASVVNTAGIPAARLATPAFLAWGGYEGGAVLGCVLGAAQ